jgi:uncharacterized protein YuzE
VTYLACNSAIYSHTHSLWKTIALVPFHTRPGGVKVGYDPEVDVLSIALSDAPVAQSDEDKPGVILDYDAGGNLIGLEILDASKRMGNPMSVEYAITR